MDVEGYIALHTNRYSVPVEWIGRRVEVRETEDKIEIQLDARRLVTHRRIAEAEHQRVMLAEHRPPRGQGALRPDPHPEEKTIVAAAPELADYVAAWKQHSRKVVTLALRQLLRLVREYPREPLLGAVREAARYGLYDLDRLERMILRRVAREYFLLNQGPHGRRVENIVMDDDRGQGEYIRQVLEAYCKTPGTMGIVRRADRMLAAQLYQRGVSGSVIENAVVLAAARRLIRPVGAPPLGTIRSLAYFLPVIEEVRELRVSPDYFQHLRRKLERIAPTR